MSKIKFLLSDVEVEVEFLGQLILPLLNDAARRDDQATLHIATNHQLLDQEPGHDGLTRSRVVREQEAERLGRQHVTVNGGDLVRQRLDLGGVDRQVGVEQVR